jgi:hypothetical protein
VQYTESRESVKYRTQQISRIIVNVKESCQVVEELLQAGQPIGFDGEGVNLGPKGMLRRSCIHCKKRLAVLPSPAGMSLTKLSLKENNLIIPSQ